MPKNDCKEILLIVVMRPLRVAILVFLYFLCFPVFSKFSTMITFYNQKTIKNFLTKNMSYA